MARKLKVHNQSMGPNYIQVPTIILKGQWLKAAGFNDGDYVEVVCEGDKITLTKTEAPEKKESLDEKIEGLNEKQRKELSKFIDTLKK